MFEHAQKLFDEMPELKCQRTVKSFNALLAACLDSKKFGYVEKLFQELPQKLGVEANVVSYNTVIKALSEMGSMDSALSVFDTMEKKGLEPSVVTFNTLIDGFFSKGLIADGDKIWELMEKKNIVPNIWTYNSKLKGLACENKMLEAVELWEEMESKGNEPDVLSYNSLIKGYSNNGNLEQVKKWYSKLKKSCCLPDRFTYLTLVSFLCKKNELEMAAEVCKEAMDRRVVSGTAFIRRLIGESMIEEATQLVELGKSRFDLKLKLPLI